MKLFKAESKGFAVIVYPEESGTLLESAFHEHGIQCLCICLQQTKTAGINHLDYRRGIQDNGDISAILDVLKQYPLLCVLPGSERGVPRADQISAKLNLLSNDYQHSEARCNKSVMAKTANAAGLRVPWQVTLQSERQLHALISNGLDWPVILKPTTSMGSEDVILCFDTESLRHGFSRILNTENRLGRQNRECIVQEYLSGNEYAIDTVSYAGTHQVTAIWQYHKSGSEIIGIVPFNSKRLLDPKGAIQKRLLSYTCQLLDSLGIQYGPAHTELIVEGKLVQLMEIGARLHGGTSAMFMSHACSGESQVEACARAYANPQSFLRKRQLLYELSSHGEIVLLIAPDNKCYANSISVETINALASVVSINIDMSTDQPLSRIAGLVLLNHANRQMIESDLNTIRCLEKSGLYISAI